MLRIILTNILLPMLRRKIRKDGTQVLPYLWSPSQQAITTVAKPIQRFPSSKLDYKLLADHLSSRAAEKIWFIR